MESLVLHGVQYLEHVLQPYLITAPIGTVIQWPGLLRAKLFDFLRVEEEGSKFS